MANASNKQKGECGRFLNTTPPPAPGVDTDCMTHLQTISFAFYQAYQQRQSADYDIVKPWTRTQALAIIDSVDAAFKAMPQVRDHKATQAYLFSLLGDPKGRQ